MADSNNASNGGKDYMMRNNWERNYPVTTKGMTDPEHYHYDRNPRAAPSNYYPPSNNTLNPIRSFDQDYAPNGRVLLRGPPHYFSCPMPSPLPYDDASTYDAQESLTLHDLPSSPGLLDNVFIENQNHGQTLIASYPTHGQDLTPDLYLTPSISSPYDSSELGAWSSPTSQLSAPTPASPTSLVSSASPSADLCNTRSQSSTLKIPTPRSRARNTPRHLQHQYLDTILRSKFPEDRMTALNMAIKFRDEHPRTDPIPNELLDQLLGGPEGDKFYCFCCPKAKKLRTITPARDHVRKSLGNFPFKCPNAWCQHSSLRQADLNKHIKTCFPPTNQAW